MAKNPSYDRAYIVQTRLERVKKQLERDAISTAINGINRVIRYVRAIDAWEDIDRRDLDAIRKDIYPLMASQMNSASVELKKDLSEIYAAIEKTEVAYLKGERGSVRLPAKSRAWLDEPLAATGQSITELLSGLEKDTAARIVRVVATGYAASYTIDETVRDLRDVLGPTSGIVTNSIRTIVRTVTQGAMQAARFNVWEANKVRKYRIIATLDTRTSEVCQALDGQEFPIGEGPVPPLHPNCRSTTIPVFADDDDGGTRASADGPVDADMTYYEWLETQPKDVQDEVLGKQMAAKFREPGISAEDFRAARLGPGLRPLSVADFVAAV